MLNFWPAGNRSSVDGANMGGNEEDETVVEPEQGNGKLSSEFTSQIMAG